MEMINKYWAAQALALDIEMLQCESALSAISIESEANAKRAELKVMCENGTYDDLFELYREASGEASDKKKNIFVRMIEAIVNFVRNLTDKITKLFKKAPEDKDTQIEVPYTKDTPNAVQKAANTIGGVIDRALHGSINVPDVAKLGAAVVTAIGVPGGVLLGINKWKKAKLENSEIKEQEAKAKAARSTTTKGQAEEDCNIMQKAINGLSSKLKALADKFKKDDGNSAGTDNQNQNQEGGDGQKDGLIKSVIDFTGGWIKKVGEKISQTTSKIFGKKNESSNSEESDNNENSNSSSNKTIADGIREMEANSSAVGSESGSEKQESVSDVLDISDDNGMAAFEAALDAIVFGDEHVTTESSDEELDVDDDVDENSEEAQTALESAAAEFDALFGDEEDE